MWKFPLPAIPFLSLIHILDNVNIVADIVHYCVKGIEAPYIRGQIGEELDDETGWAYVAKIVYGALGRKEQNKE